MESKKLVKDEQVHSCGCHVILFADGTTKASPCLAHGLATAARALAGAAEVLLATAARLEREIILSRAARRE